MVRGADRGDIQTHLLAHERSMSVHIGAALPPGMSPAEARRAQWRPKVDEKKASQGVCGIGSVSVIACEHQKSQPAVYNSPAVKNGHRGVKFLSLRSHGCLPSPASTLLPAASVLGACSRAMPCYF
jgi:hypothetical protein